MVKRPRTPPYRHIWASSQKKNAWAMEEDVQSSATTLKNNTPNNITFDPNI
jgi:hypothetical protein